MAMAMALGLYEARRTSNLSTQSSGEESAPSTSGADIHCCRLECYHMIRPPSDQADCSVNNECSKGELDEQGRSCPRRRSREETCSGPGNKACREKMRRYRLNDRFMELSNALEPGRPPKTDKAVILSDAIRVLQQLRTEAEQLKDSNNQLQDAIKELKAEKNELRDEKLRLKTEKEKLEQQVKALTLPAGYLPHFAAIHAAAAVFAAQTHAISDKASTLPGYPGMAMWQWMPPAAVDTSQDHVLRPPVA